MHEDDPCEVLAGLHERGFGGTVEIDGSRCKREFLIRETGA